MNKNNLSQLSAEQIIAKLNTSATTGLSSSAIADRLKTSGYNELPHAQINWLTLVWRQINSPLIYLLLAAALISLITQDYLNTFLIIAIITVNTSLGFFQEFSAQHAASLLQSYIKPKTKVIRDGKIIEVDNRTIVPGDLLMLDPGDQIPADIRFIKTDHCLVDESVLTGESAPVNKTHESATDTSNIGYMGTFVVSGTGTGIVIATGAQTNFGSISKLTTQAIPESSFHRSLIKLSIFLIILGLSVLAIVFITHLLFKNGTVPISQLFMFAIALAITVTPEALPVVLTFALSEGARLLAREKVIVKRLSAIEDLGSINLLCMDKTGTLTENQLTVAALYVYHDEDPLFLANLEQQEKVTGGFEKALQDAQMPEMQEHLREFVFAYEEPFDPQRRRKIILMQHDHDYLMICKGALEDILSLSTNVENITEINQWAHDQGLLGRRIIAIAYKKFSQKPDRLVDEEHDLSFAGMIAFEDPLKTTAPDAIQQAKKLKIALKIITGDSPDVAGAVAYHMKLISSVDQVITGQQFEEASDAEKKALVKKQVVFARITPQQKYEIIELLKHDYVVGFLGEGINDAPALKAAHVGIVVKGASDIAQSASDIILLKRSLHVIINGIRTGRSVYTNTAKYLRISLGSVIGNFYSIAFFSFFIDFLPMLPIQILLANLLSDFPMIAIATDTVEPSDLHSPSEYNFKEMAPFCMLVGLVASCSDLVFFIHFNKAQPPVLQTNWFLLNLIEQTIVLYSLRTNGWFWRAHRPSSLLICLAIIFGSISVILPFTGVGHYFFSFVTPTLHDILYIITVSLCYFIAVEIVKVVYFKTVHKLYHAKKIRTS